MKRAKGSGSIFKRGRIWFVQYGTPRRRESSGSEDRKVAEKLLYRRLGEVSTGTLLGLEAGKATLGQLIDLVIADHEFRGLRSAKETKWRATAHFDEAFRKQSAAKFNEADIRQYVVNRRAENASNATINRELAILRYAYTLGMRAAPPLAHKAPRISLLEENNIRQGFLEPEQYETLLAALPDRLKAMFVCAYHVGTRKGELRNMRWDQIDWEANLIRLEGTQTKTKKPRTLPIYGDMERWLRTQQETNLPDCQWVFHWRGMRLGKELYGWREACELAGVPGLLFHDLRRSAVRNMRRAGIPDHEAMRITGHQTRKMYERYDIVDETDISNAGERLEAFFEKRRKERAAKLERVK